MNLYHHLLLVWTFHSKDRYNPLPLEYHNHWKMNGRFSNNKVPVLVSKRQSEENITASVPLLLSRRMREGYTVDVSISRGSEKCSYGIK